MKTILKISIISILVLSFTQIQAQEKSKCCAKETTTTTCKKDKKSCKKKHNCNAQDSAKCTKTKCCKKSEAKQCKKNMNNDQTTINSKEQNSTFMVMGACNLCKTRIENAALIYGVKKAEWNKEAQAITVIFDSSKISELDIHKAIATVGHKTSSAEPNMEAYAKLPMCCKYLDNAQTH